VTDYLKRHPELTDEQKLAISIAVRTKDEGNDEGAFFECIYVIILTSFIKLKVNSAEISRLLRCVTNPQEPWNLVFNSSRKKSGILRKSEDLKFNFINLNRV